MQSQPSRFSERFGLRMPVALAPMALASGGALAAACARAGALGLLGGGYGELDWVRREYQLAEKLGPCERIGCGFITWKLGEDSSALDWVLDRRPCAIMLSFGDPSPYSARIAQAGAALICQVQRLDQVPQAIDSGAQVIVAQGMEAGGHGADAIHGRGTFSFVPEVADWLAAHSAQTILLAAGGIADARGVAAARALGAGGVLIGTRLWASTESLAAEASKQVAVRATGDDTARSSVFDILRQKNWPRPYDFRAIRNSIHRRWEDRVHELRAAPDVARGEYDAAVANGDYDGAHVTVGSAVGMVRRVADAEAILREIAG